MSPAAIRGILAMVWAGALSAAAITAAASGPAAPAVTVAHLPAGGLQPQAVVDAGGRVHVVYVTGAAEASDIYYIQSADGGHFSNPVPVNSTPKSAIAMGTVRGPAIAAGAGGRIHVAWNGAHAGAEDTPMYYTRLNDAGDRFEPQRRVPARTYDVDGGGAITADSGRVTLFWHANVPGEQGEGARRVWMTRSSDAGRTFDAERPVSDGAAGACGCCSLRAFTDRAGSLYVLFRSALETVHRDIYLLSSRDGGDHFRSSKVDEWNVGACMMTTQAFAEGAGGLYAAWETRGQVQMGRVDAAAGTVGSVTGAPGDRTRKHPALAVDRNGFVLLAWTEATSWGRGGSAAWQLYDGAGAAVGPPGHAAGVPAWGLVAVYPTSTGFSILF